NILRARRLADFYAGSSSTMGRIDVMRTHMERVSILGGLVLFVLIGGCGPKKNTMLNHAARNGTLEDMEHALQTGADVNTVGESNNTPLHEAALGDNAVAAQFLVEHGANVNSIDEDKDTPLHFCAAHGSRKVAAVLIKAGAKIDPV